MAKDRTRRVRWQASGMVLDKLALLLLRPF
jgi:hypothetical protein